MLLTNLKFKQIVTSGLVVLLIVTSFDVSFVHASENLPLSSSQGTAETSTTMPVQENGSESSEEQSIDLPEENTEKENTETKTEDRVESKEDEPTGEKELPDDPKEDQADEPEPVPIELPPLTVKQKLPDTDINSGALVYEYTLTSPSGRKGLESNVSLQYNSQNNEEGSLVGYGWNLSLPYIERKNINGINKLYTSEYFTSSTEGELKKVSATGSVTIFGVKIENGNFHKYEYNNKAVGGEWIVETKTGQKYFYGTTVESRINNPSDASKVFRWYLTKTEDASGNFVAYDYLKHNDLPYLSSVNYTGHEISSGLFSMEFNWEERPDKSVSGKYGYMLKVSQRLNSVELLVGESSVGLYEVEYEQASTNQRSLLSAIEYIGQEASGGNTSSRATSFAYQQEPSTGLLTRVTQPTGGKTNIDYVSSTQLKNADGSLSNPNMPFDLSVVKTLEYDDNNGIVWGYDYAYSGGWFYYNGPFDRRFVGFENVTKTDSVGNTTSTWYHQGNGDNPEFDESVDDWSKAGKAYRVDMYDVNGNLFERVINNWAYVRLPGIDNLEARSFVKLISSLGLSYDGNDDFRAKAVGYDYDSIGNLITKINYGEVSVNELGAFTDTGTDRVTLNTTFAQQHNSEILTGFISSETILNQDNQKLQEARSLYDGLSFGDVAIGNLTTKQQWVSGSNYASSNYTYDSHGQVLSETDPNGNMTSYSYDKHNLYPETITNALLQTTSYEYDYRFGEPKRVVDSNGLVTKLTYDALGRRVSEQLTIPNQSDPNNLFTKQDWEYSLHEIGGQAQGWKTLNRIYLDEASTSNPRFTKQISYTDGFDRLVQNRFQAESELGSSSERFVASDIKYNTIGQIETTTLPYFSDGQSRTSFNNNTNLRITLEYDTLYRVVSTQNVVGRTRNSFDNWNIRTTDAAGKIKDLYKDAYAQLVSVGEHNVGNIYTTSYRYDGLGNLLQITDALGNLRNFSYDGRGLRTQAEDLHAPTDSTFGVWADVYDSVGNLKKRVDPNGLNVRYDYDKLNRVVSENAGNDKTVEVSYNYDLCSNGVGRLCGASSGSSSHAIVYDRLGQITQETKTIDGVNYITGYNYDRQGKQLIVTNPDGSEVKNSYNESGNIETVQTKEAVDGNYSNVVTNIDYSPIGAVNFISYANGGQTTNNYDSSKLYRLSSKISTVPIPGGGVKKIQNYIYRYDLVGNIIGITDTSELSTRKTMYYWYDDLHRLVLARSSRAVGGSNYIESYQYNAIGNITYKSSVGNYTYDGSVGNNYANPHAVTSIVTSSGPAQQFVYDKNGNLLSDGNKDIEWDYDNRISRITPGGITPSTIDYTYDFAGARIKVAVAGAQTTVYPSPGYNTSGGIGNSSVQKHVFAGALLVGTIKGSGVGVVSSTVHSDHLGSTTVVTNSSGGVSETLDYYPFGEIRRQSTSSGTTEQRTFIGQEYDTETGLSYLQARYYDGHLGKFLSQDAVHLAIGDAKSIKEIVGVEVKAILVDPQILNGYSYSKNNPINYADPDGNIVVAAAAVAYLALEAGFTAWDAVDVYLTFKNKESTVADKALSLGFAGIGLVIPGGGYNTARKLGLKGTKELLSQKQIVDNVIREIDNLGEISRFTKWRDPTTLPDHFIRHADDFGIISMESYARNANNFYKESISGRHAVKIDADGTRRVYDYTTNAFASYSPDGKTKTFFKPSEGAGYFRRQPGKLIRRR